MAREYTWTNPDGLVVGYGPRDTVNPQNGPYKTEGLHKESVKRAVGVDLVDADTAAAEGYEVPIPADSVITAVYVEVTETFVGGGTSTLDVGLKQKDGTTIDDDGLVAAAAEADLTAGAVISGAGVLVGDTIGSVAGYITVTWDTAAFTAGDAKVIVEYLLQPSA